MTKLGDLTELLSMEAFALHRDIDALSGLLKACPNCSMVRAVEIKRLDELAGAVKQVVAGLKAMTEEAREGTKRGGESQCDD